jgi:hypothetical protein
VVTPKPISEDDDAGTQAVAIQQRRCDSSLQTSQELWAMARHHRADCDVVLIHELPLEHCPR